MLPPYSPLARHWLLERDMVFLNHGSFGACPRPILKKQMKYRAAMERQPVRFMVRELESLVWQAKQALGVFIGAAASDVLLVPNTTYALNIVLHSLTFEPGDELLTTTHAYGACLHALQRKAQQCGARLVMADVPFPISDPAEVVEAIRRALSPRTRLAVIDHISSPTALVFPIKAIVEVLAKAGVDCFVDGAHAPGHVTLNVSDIGAAYYAGNAHKWLCTPKGSAFLFVRRDRQHLIRPMVTSHRYDAPTVSERQWSAAFFWSGTYDYSPWLCIVDALQWLPTLKGTISALLDHNHKLCLTAVQCICQQTDRPPSAPASMLGCMAALVLGPAQKPPFSFNYLHPLQNALWEQYRTEVPVYVWGNPPQLLCRISAYCYNSPEQYEYMAKALVRLLPHYVGCRTM
ncbi:MAG: aminotransferase class V-fold PLP-dependent enzyme [Chitinophagales bacterium]|nr:aminotransferase class V-fold PLP-dependent enzyme [Chitinophagales bacterium]MDW8427859.1 aminotransferase class V-fold PLP-dependent enzyme [Chitinophagales bacterium]